MEAVILAGGKGSRLKPFTTILPKPLMPVGENAILSIVLQQLKTAGVKKVTIAVNHMANLIMAYFGSGEKIGIDIDYSFEDKPLSTIAPIKLINNLPEHFLVMNGDVLTDLDYIDLYRSHLEAESDLTIATYQRDVTIDFGVLEIDNNSSKLTDFHEKPSYHFSVSMGVYVFNRSLLELVPFNEPYGLDDLVIDMLNKQRSINVYQFKGYWLDIGRPDDYEKANKDIDNPKYNFLKLYK